MKKLAMVVAGLLVVAIGIYVFTAGDNAKETVGQEAQNIKQLVHDYSIRKLTAQSASINSRQLIVTDHHSKKATYDLPDDEFFVSIAPFVDSTHPCAIHSLSGCQGEMTDTEFHVSIEDQQGKVILDETMKSMANGFIDLWLPRDQRFKVKITHAGKTAVSTITTFDGDNTCITTMQLKENAA